MLSGGGFPAVFAENNPFRSSTQTDILSARPAHPRNLRPGHPEASALSVRAPPLADVEVFAAAITARTGVL
jgi:hypothetical protein